MSASPVAAIDGGFSERDLALRWASPTGEQLRLADGRPLKVVFPGTPGGGAGPDFRGAILDAGGDLLRGDVELHLRASGWFAHGHHRDRAYDAVVLHVVAENDLPLSATAQRSRQVPILVLPGSREQGSLPPFRPPCTFAAARGLAPEEILARLGRRRLRMKAARWQPLAEAAGAGPAFYAAALEIIGGPANRSAFASIARSLPLPALLERAAESGAARQLAVAAELKGVARSIPLRRAGLRPMSQPGRRLEAAAALFAHLFSAGPGWPFGTSEGLLARLRVGGIGRSLGVEIAVNAVLPVALASSAWSEDETLAAFAALPSPGTYGRLRPLEGWLRGETTPFAVAAQLQGGLLLHTEYCTTGRCGRCPLSPG